MHDDVVEARTTARQEAVENAGRFVHEANAEVMKCEGNRHHAKNIEAIVQAGIPVQGHIGITPMRSLLLTLRERGDTRPIWLIHAARTESRLPFLLPCCAYPATERK